jgi:hypothetical protein
VTKLAPNGIAGAAIGLVAIFLPGMLILCGTLPFWVALRARPLAQAAMRGTNAAVVGILGVALYDPLWTTAILNPRDFALALIAFVLLTAWKSPLARLNFSDVFPGAPKMDRMWPSDKGGRTTGWREDTFLEERAVDANRRV